MKYYISIFVLTLVLFQLPPSFLVLAQTDPIDDYIQVEMKKRKIPGLALVVIRNGEVVKMKGYGFANLEHDVPVTPDTVFELASVTKQFTAAAIMLLVEDGKIKLDDSITQYLPRSPQQWNNILVRHLLTHTAGFPSLQNGFKSLREGGGRTNYTTAQMFEAATKDTLSFGPGERWQYSDVGYFLLGMIIEKASGQTYRGFLTNRFFEPLGMATTTILDQWAVLKNRAAGYALRNDQVVNIRRVAQIELPSHYGVFLECKGFGQMGIWTHNGENRERIKPGANVDARWKLATSGSFPYGFGWEIVESHGHRMITHNGITGTEYTRFPDDELTAIVSDKSRVKYRRHNC